MPLAAIVTHFMADQDWPAFFDTVVVVEIDGGFQLEVDGDRIFTVKGMDTPSVDSGEFTQ